LAVDLQQWIADDHASVLTRFENAVGVRVPVSRWKEHGEAANGGTTSSIAWLLFHATYHQDLALNTAVRNHPPMLEQHRAALGLAAFAPMAGLTEAEDVAVTEALELGALRHYVELVNASTQDWIDDISILALDSIPTSSWRLEHKAGILAAGEMAWLHTMWTDKPVSWFVQWECIGHGHTHVGEMTAIRNRMGLSPF
jgi:hypothetical protein